MTFIRRLLCVLLCASALASVSFAQDFPTRRLSIVVPFPAGSPADVRARVIATHLATRLKQPVIIDNRPGAAGNIAAALVAKAKPDGYTLLYANNGQMVINQYIYKDAGYDGVKDFAPITQLVAIPWVFIANSQLPANNVKELIALAKTQPGKLNYASSGVGTPQHVVGAQLGKVAGINMLHVPYKGENLSINDLLNGQVSTMFSTPVSALPLIKAGKVKVLAVTAAKRINALPQTPTMAETLPGFESMGWSIIAAPAGTPAPIVALLNQHIAAIMLMPEVKDREEQAGYQVLANSAAQAAQSIKAESAHYAKLISDLKLSAE